MINILFWNTNMHNQEGREKKCVSINDALLSLIDRFALDILVLAEYPFPLETICDRISTIERDFYVGSVSMDTRVHLLLDRRFTNELIGDSGYHFSCQIETLRTDYSFLLSGVHLPSRLYASNESIKTVARTVMNDIREAEIRRKTNNCLIVGDFNASPFDNAMIECDSFHAIPFSDIVQKKETRRFYGKDYQMFYNPMWNFLGDFEGKKQTYFYNASEACNLYRYVFDQVLVSASMIKYFVPSSLTVVSEVPGISLVNDKGIPDKDKFSDHLPILFSLQEEK